MQRVLGQVRAGASIHMKMKTTVTIEWDEPSKPSLDTYGKPVRVGQWLCPANIARALHRFCGNTHFQVSEADAPAVVATAYAVAAKVASMINDDVVRSKAGGVYTGAATEVAAVAASEILLLTPAEAIETLDAMMVDVMERTRAEFALWVPTEQLTTTRAEAMESAAKIADTYGGGQAAHVARSIRAAIDGDDAWIAKSTQTP